MITMQHSTLFKNRNPTISVLQKGIFLFLSILTDPFIFMLRNNYGNYNRSTFKYMKTSFPVFLYANQL